RFLTRLDDVIALGFDERFLRMWDFYLASCEAGFSERHTSDVQVVLARGSERQSDPLFSLDPVE
ncbi:MAG: SAM-dependent methyltransferase, partial [Gemmatimonadetes bacterium]|nr:SAM-dependent methyltransferase [Gemmatimonadota bacterium]